MQREKEWLCLRYAIAKDKCGDPGHVPELRYRSSVCAVVLSQTKYLMKKYVRVIRYIYLNCETGVRSAIGKTDAFKVNVGLHQRSAKPFPSCVVMGVVQRYISHTRTHTYLPYTHIHTYIYIHLQLHIHARTHTCMNTYTHAPTHARANTHTHLAFMCLHDFKRHNTTTPGYQECCIERTKGSSADHR